MNKYRNKKVVIGDQTFDSKKEGNRYIELTLLQRAGRISALETQPKFDIKIHDKHICYYKADFRYLDNDTGLVVIEDVKSPITKKEPLYRLKKKLTEAMHTVEIIEV